MRDASLSPDRRGRSADYHHVDDRDDKESYREADRDVEDGPFHAPGDVGALAYGLDTFDDLVDLTVCGVFLHDDDHGF